MDADPPLDRPVPTFSDVLGAAQRLGAVAHRTPVMTSRTLDALVGARVYLKCENFQRGGAFKFRGAYAALSWLPAAARAAGVLAYSSGNHAQAVALAAGRLGIAATRGYGAEIVTYDRYAVDREELAATLAAEADEQGVELADVLDQLEGGRALARDDVGMVVGRHDREAVLGGEGGGQLLAVDGVPVVGDDLGAVAAGRRDLRRGRVERHHDGRRDAQPAGRERDRLRVVARRVRQHPGRPRRRR